MIIIVEVLGFFVMCGGDNVEFRAFSTFITKVRKKLKTQKKG